ncbi:hypothetical protein CEXT_77521 [Caerostris extrusa]|uniref:Uncharacterized protein n=1 Tax=Caerostris extrusa TaxID=172846 RepID=A0AAV4N528_CAEEX|nr:hypothetical protein CEXT_77521 [Caerostris extrusa]
MTTMFLPLCVLVVLASMPSDVQSIGGFGGKVGFRGKFGLGGIVDMVGQMAPLIPSDAEKDICMDVAQQSGQELLEVKKEIGNTCYAVCVMDTENFTIESPKGTLCCDIVGVGPTEPVMAVEHAIWLE